MPFLERFLTVDCRFLSRKPDVCAGTAAIFGAYIAKLLGTNRYYYLISSYLWFYAWPKTITIIIQLMADRCAFKKKKKITADTSKVASMCPSWKPAIPNWAISSLFGYYYSMRVTFDRGVLSVWRNDNYHMKLPEYSSMVNIKMLFTCAINDERHGCTQL